MPSEQEKPSVNAEVVVKCKQGMHLRYAAELVKVISGFRSKVWIAKGVQKADGGSVLELLGLAALCGTRLQVTVVGADSELALSAVCDYFSKH